MAETESAEDFLAHFGVKGMKWGKHTSSSSSSGGDSSGGSTAPTKKDLKALDKASKAADIAKRDAEIDKARSDYNTSARKNYLDAKAQYKIDKVTIGKREAAKAFNAVKDKNIRDAEVANMAKSGKETTALVLTAVGGIVLSAAIRAAAA